MYENHVSRMMNWSVQCPLKGLDMKTYLSILQALLLSQLYNDVYDLTSIIRGLHRYFQSAPVVCMRALILRYHLRMVFFKIPKLLLLFCYMRRDYNANYGWYDLVWHPLSWQHDWRDHRSIANYCQLHGIRRMQHIGSSGEKLSDNMELKVTLFFHSLDTTTRI